MDDEEVPAVGVAAVPGALSVPRRPPRARPIPPPPILFEAPILFAGPILVEGPAREPAPARERAAAREKALVKEEAPAKEKAAQGPSEKPPAIRAPAPTSAPAGAGPESRDEPRQPVRNRGLLKDLGRRAALPALAAALAAFVAGTTYFALATRATATQDPLPDLGRWAAAGRAREGAGNAARPSGDPFASADVVVSGAPTRVRIKAIGLDSALETLHIAENALQPPKRFDRAGWYADGTVPGDIGPAVIAGHVDSRAGPAVFYRLRELTVGDRIDVLRGGRTVSFVVTRTAWYPKRAFPTEEVYGPTPDRQLRLITCGGVFDHRLRSYRDNLVVYAVAG
ncbi:class F sortase [Paractinoplanes rhizophilus]|uniref:Class F sortase n=1 Tax=Paractinoplanes rhizophilus TaxID=1416877 RepID=A0ABW2HTZ1_9ACTN